MKIPRTAPAVVLLAALVVAAFPKAAPAALPSASSGAVVIKIASIAPSRSPWDKVLEQVARDAPALLHHLVDRLRKRGAADGDGARAEGAGPGGHGCGVAFHDANLFDR